MINKTPIVLSIAGSDSGGGAGVQADIKTISANGAFAASVITAVTAQNTKAVIAVHEVPAYIIAAQMDAVLTDLSVDVIKLGMLFSVEIIDTVAERLNLFNGKVVVDPVMIAKSGDALLQEEAIDALITKILPYASLLSPNLPEAARLLNMPQAKSPEEMVLQAKQLLGMGPEAILMKGGHSDESICTDVLVDTVGTFATYSCPRIDTTNTHGTGCTYAAAIAAQLACGEDLKNAVKTAHQYLANAIKAADTLKVGRGQGPVHHFVEYWHA